MKKITLLLFFSLLFFISCKKDKVDASSTMAFQTSINDMTSSLSTMQQIKFNEALYILKKFAVEGDDDITELKALGKFLEGKKVPEILSLADQTAQKNNVSWSSSGPPSLGEMNIFGSEKTSETDPNDVEASAVNILVKPISIDSILGPKAIQIIPKLVDSKNTAITFSGAALETMMEVFSGGEKIITSKNLMMDNNFKGYTIRFSTLPKEKIIDDKIDVKITVKTSKKTIQFTKAGIAINPKALLMPIVDLPKNTEENADPNTNPTENPQDPTIATNTNTADPKSSVSKFLNNLSTQNLKAAYDSAQNPNWGSYESFANPTSGFGTVKNISVKNLNTTNTTENSANVNATYDVTDKNGTIIPLKVTFGMKNVNGDWKITSYKIN